MSQLLTPKSIAALAPTGKPTMDDATKGFGVIKNRDGTVTFIAVARWDGKNPSPWKIENVEGKVTAQHIESARQRAVKRRQTLKTGQNPKVAEKRAVEALRKAERLAEATTFDALLPQYIKWKCDEQDHRQWDRDHEDLERDALPVLTGKQVRDIDKLDCEEVLLRPLQRAKNGTRKRGSRTAPGKRASFNMAAKLRAFFEWAIRKEYVEQGKNPMRLVDRLAVAGLKKKKDFKRKRTLSDVECRAFWNATESLSPAAGPYPAGYPFGTAYRILIATGGTLNEVAKARWDRYDPKAGTLTVISEVFKSGDHGDGDREHILVLSSGAKAIVDSLPRVGTYIFSFDGGRSPIATFGKAKPKLDALMKEQIGEFEGWRNHDLRRVVRSGLGKLGIRPHISEAILGHSAGVLVETYDTNDYIAERRAALQLWWDKRVGPGFPDVVEESNVIQLHGVRS